MKYILLFVVVRVVADSDDGVAFDVDADVDIRSCCNQDNSYVYSVNHFQSIMIAFWPFSFSPIKKIEYTDMKSLHNLAVCVVGRTIRCVDRTCGRNWKYR